MPGEDSERSFEKALAHHLRANPASANPTSEVNARHAACPNGEVLAAYHERMLAPEQMTSWKEHIVLCSRCQDILAHVEATDELPVGVGEEEEAEKVLPMTAKSEPEVAGAVRASGPVRTASAPSGTTVAEITASRETKQSWRTVRWRWIAPAGAVAAGLLIWIAIRQSHAPEFELAKNQASRVAAPAPAPAFRPAPSLERQNETDPRRSGDSNSLTALNESRRAASEGKTPLRDNFAAALKQKAVGVPEAKTKTGLDQLADKSAPISAGKSSDVNAFSKEREERKDGGKSGNRASSTALVAPSPSAPAPAVGGVVGKITGGRQPEKPARDEALEATKKEAPAAAAQSVEVEAETQAINGAVRTKALPQAMRLTRGQTPAVIPAPGKKAIWRAGPAGIVEHSTNAGIIWTPQRTGVTADLVAGSAPSEDVCWIVGRAGAILRTEDGGAHWIKLQAPVDDDFAKVFAVDAQQATVFTASTHRAYRTTDGGLTWTQLTD